VKRLRALYKAISEPNDFYNNTVVTVFRDFQGRSPLHLSLAGNHYQAVSNLLDILKNDP
jgi:ankyrin repeat protein